MKTFITLLIFALSVNCFGQIKLSIDEVDEFDGSVQKLTKSTKCFTHTSGYGTLSIRVGSVNDYCFYEFTISNNIGCLSEYEGRALIKLTDGTIIEGIQIGSTDCSAPLSARYIPITREESKSDEGIELMKERIEVLKATPIETIRIYGTKGKADFKPNSAFRKFDAKEALIYHLKAVE